MGLKQYSRICPDCSRTVNYNTYKVFWKARKNNSTCRQCFYKSIVGHETSEETRRKIGDANKISLLGNIPHNKGKAMPMEQREKLSIIHTGKKMPESFHRKHRTLRLKRIDELGIPPNQDRGAKEFLRKFNKEEKLKLKPTRFFEIGYEADGYDKICNVWLEFDPPHHFYVDGSLKPNDILRQKRIIEYFENKNTPLSKFIRVKADKHGNVLKIETVYKGEN